MAEKKDDNIHVTKKLAAVTSSNDKLQVEVTVANDVLSELISAHDEKITATPLCIWPLFKNSIVSW